MKLSPIILESDNMLIHPFRQKDAIRHDKMIEDIFEIFSEDEVVKYVPEKKMTDKSLAQSFILQCVSDSFSGTQITEFITFKKLNKIIGVIEIISPDKIQQFYPDIPEEVWMIEFYLNKNYWGYKIMTHSIGAVIKDMFIQGVKAIGAITRRENASSISLLQANAFSWKMEYDIYQDYYERLK